MGPTPPQSESPNSELQEIYDLLVYTLGVVHLELLNGLTLGEAVSEELVFVEGNEEWTIAGEVGAPFFEEGTIEISGTAVLTADVEATLVLNYNSVRESSADPALTGTVDYS